MTDVFNEGLRGWQNFYFMIGGASATLIGLMFVALSLGQHLISDKTRDEMKIFATPSIIYFVTILLLSGAMLVPIFTPSTLALVLFLGGGAGFVRTAFFAIRLTQAAIRNQDFNLGEWLAQIIAPVASYAFILLAAVCFALDQSAPGLIVIWVATLLLLLCAIANTWSLVTWIVEQRTT